MTIHYSVESLLNLFLSEEFISDKNKYKQLNARGLDKANKFLDSIEINKNYYRTGLVVKNPKYKKKVSDDTLLLKSFRTSLNKMSSLNYLKLCPVLVTELRDKHHLYPLIIQLVFEQALLHHTYSKYYSYLVELLHKQFNNSSVINTQIDKTHTELRSNTSSSKDTEYSQLCSKNKSIDQLIGYSIFVSELEMKGIILNRIDLSVQSILEQMETNLSEDEAYKCVICLYNIFKVIYLDKPIKPEYIEQLTDIKSTIKYMKIKFKIMDILERR